jgi:hypothetical protein
MNCGLGLCDLLPNFHPRVADRQWLSDELLNDRFVVTFNIEKHAVDALLREKYGHDGHHDY